ncbi:hypothetical protein KBC86_04320 [Candidatus Gracilibacteria bacterium]|nr:hypothetical protein [Candidatus Gracilibacteria bacterium]
MKNNEIVFLVTLLSLIAGGIGFILAAEGLITVKLFLQIFFGLILLVITSNFILYLKKIISRIKAEIQEKYSEEPLSYGLPQVLSSNEEKRRYFLGKELGYIPTEANWIHAVTNQFNPKYFFFYCCGIVATIFLFVQFGAIQFTIFIFSIVILYYPILVLLFLIHALYRLYAKLYNFWKEKTNIIPNGKIYPTSQSDIGKTSPFSAKIEKLWI